MSVFSRRVYVEMDWIDESAFEIKGTLDDNVHSVTARFVVGFPDYVIREAVGDITRMPYDGFCQGAYKSVSRFVGERIGPGFRKRAAEIAGGAESCNHLHTLIVNMGISAFQMNYVAAKRNPDAMVEIRRTANDPARRRDLVLGWMPQLRNSCYVFSESSDSLFEDVEQGSQGSDSNSAVGDVDGKVL
jgi:hypothetical protein